MALQHYSVMTNKEISALPVRDIASDRSILFLWATYPGLQLALSVMERWGFRYITAGFTWVKTNRKSGSLYWGMGNYTRANAEVCLIGVSKNFKAKHQIKSRSVHSLIVTPVRAHSQKPTQAREKIEILLGDVPRIELFALEQVDGWDCWGNEV